MPPAAKPLDRPSHRAAATPSPEKKKKKKKDKDKGEKAKDAAAPSTMLPVNEGSMATDAVSLLAEVMAGTPRGKQASPLKIDDSAIVSPAGPSTAVSKAAPDTAEEEAASSARTSSSEETDTVTSNTDRSADDDDAAPEESIPYLLAREAAAKSGAPVFVS